MRQQSLALPYHAAQLVQNQVAALPRFTRCHIGNDVPNYNGSTNADIAGAANAAFTISTPTPQIAVGLVVSGLTDGTGLTHDDLAGAEITTLQMGGVQHLLGTGTAPGIPAWLADARRGLAPTAFGPRCLPLGAIYWPANTNYQITIANNADAASAVAYSLGILSYDLDKAKALGIWDGNKVQQCAVRFVPGVSAAVAAGATTATTLPCSREVKLDRIYGSAVSTAAEAVANVADNSELIAGFSISTLSRAENVLLTSGEVPGTWLLGNGLKAPVMVDGATGLSLFVTNDSGHAAHFVFGGTISEYVGG